jgi:hypothetical protein
LQYRFVLLPKIVLLCAASQSLQNQSVTTGYQLFRTARKQHGLFGFCSRKMQLDGWRAAICSGLPRPPVARFNGTMPALTRRRYPERQDCWHVYFGDVHVGTIARSVGNPNAAPQWQWRCGFYPGSRPGECTGGTAPTFDHARADYEAAWRVFSATRTEADYQAWRDQRDRTERKYAMWDRGERFHSQQPSAR